jgi:hypothetical protein
MFVESFRGRMTNVRLLQFLSKNKKPTLKNEILPEMSVQI